MNAWTLRLARDQDTDHMPAIESAAGKLFATEAELAIFDFSETWEPAELRPLVARGHCLVAHVGEEMAGFLIAEPCGSELHICEMNVHPAYQRRGIGAGLIRASQIDARNCGFRALTLTTYRDLAWNGPFYARLGFDEIDDPAFHPRLAACLDDEEADGLPRQRRCAMIHLLSKAA
jgi:GNAT superfamily N-acetyltransferase